jgi:hypothetical protein
MKAFRDENNGRWYIDVIEDDAITFQRICLNLVSGKNFKFARYGDGELFCMNGKIGRNCDKHEYFPDLGAMLIETVTNRVDYMIGIQPLSVSHIPHLVDQFILQTYTPKELYNADVLHNASIDGKLYTFMKSLEGRYIVLVGPAHLAGLIEEMVHIVVPDLNAWLLYKEINDQLRYHIQKDAVVLLSCGMMAEVLLYENRDSDCTIIDTGSVFDPIVGVRSRSYHFKL